MKQNAGLAELGATDIKKYSFEMTAADTDLFLRKFDILDAFAYE